jgi:hypothetical protein
MPLISNAARQAEIWDALLPRGRYRAGRGLTPPPGRASVSNRVGTGTDEPAMQNCVCPGLTDHV